MTKKNLIKTVWEHPYHWQYRQLPEQLRSWLLNETSITQRLRALCVKQFQVKVLTQRWQYPLLDEAPLLDIPLRQYARVREVYLCCEDQPWIFGRTVIPASTLRGKYRYLMGLGNRPLGSVLFSHHSVRRCDLQLAYLRPKAPLYHLATSILDKTPPLLSARRSMFYLDDKPLLVTEVFLPHILKELDDCLE
jgi:chorismate lyase